MVYGSQGLNSPNSIVRSWTSTWTFACQSNSFRLPLPLPNSLHLISFIHSNDHKMTFAFGQRSVPAPESQTQNSESRCPGPGLMCHTRGSSISLSWGRSRGFRNKWMAQLQKFVLTSEDARSRQSAEFIKRKSAKLSNVQAEWIEMEWGGSEWRVCVINSLLSRQT